MYRLYDYDVHSLIDASKNEEDIINTISVFMSATIGQRFLVKYTNEETHTDTIISTIKNVRDYYSYIQEFRERQQLKNKSCVELKREILDIQDKPKVKKIGTKK